MVCSFPSAEERSALCCAASLGLDRKASGRTSKRRDRRKGKASGTPTRPAPTRFPVHRRAGRGERSRGAPAPRRARRERAEAGREGGAGAQGGRVASPSRGARGGRSGADPLRGSEPGPGKLCRGGERGGRGGRRKLVSGRGALGSERAPAGGVCLSGFFVSPPGPSPSVRPA